MGLLLQHCCWLLHPYSHIRDSVSSESTAEIITATADESGIPGTSTTPVEEAKTAWEWYFQGYRQLRDGEAGQAVASFTTALEMKPDHVRSMINLARAYITLGQFEEAETIVREAITTDSTNSWAYHVLGRVLQSREKTEEAIMAYETSLELDGNNPWARNNLGLIQILHGNYDVAVELLEGAVETSDTVPYFFNNLGMAYEGTRDFERAREAFAEALELDPEYTRAATNLARIKKHLGEEDTVEMPEESGREEETLVAPTSDENEWGEPTYESSASISESVFETAGDKSAGSGTVSATVDNTSNPGNGRRRSKSIAMGIAFLGMAVAFAVVIAVRNKKRYGYSG
jgi:Flp pilus assembly protein TadD